MHNSALLQQILGELGAADLSAGGKDQLQVFSESAGIVVDACVEALCQCIASSVLAAAESLPVFALPKASMIGLTIRIFCSRA